MGKILLIIAYIILLPIHFIWGGVSQLIHAFKVYFYD